MHRGDHLRQSCTNSARWQACWMSVRQLQFTSVQCWFLSEVLNAPHAILSLWLGWMHHYYNTVKQAFWKVSRGVAIIISAVLVLVLLDYVNPVQLWLCGLVRRSITAVHELGPDHSVIDNKTHRGDHLPQSCTNSARWQVFWMCMRGLQFTSVGYWFWFV